MRLSLLLSLLVLPPLLHAQLARVEALPKTTFYSLASRGDTILAGSDSLLHISTDRGGTWRSTAPNLDFIDAIALTDGGWFVASSTGGVYRSLDGGATWSSASDGLGNLGVNDFEEWNGHLYAATAGWGVYEREIAEGGRWRLNGSQFADYVAENVQALHRHGDRMVAAAGGNGYLFVKPGSDSAWLPVALVPDRSPGPAALDVNALGDRLVIATSGRAYQSFDGGMKWEPTAPILRGGSSAFLAADRETLYYAVTRGPNVSDLYRSSDLDGAWEYLGTVPEVLRLEVFNGVLYMANVDGVRTYTSPASGVDPLPMPAVALALRAESGGNAEVRFTLPGTRPALLAVTDLLGRRVATLYDGVAPSGESRVAWSTESLPRGVYLLSLVAGGEVVGRPVVVGR